MGKNRNSSNTPPKGGQREQGYRSKNVAMAETKSRVTAKAAAANKARYKRK